MALPQEFLTAVEPHMLVAAVTFYERTAENIPAVAPIKSALKLERLHSPAPDSALLTRYRQLFKTVGGPWLWYSRLLLSDADLAVMLSHPDVMTMMVTNRTGTQLGILELDFRVEGQCEIPFLGLAPEMTGRGHGHWLIEQAINLAASHQETNRLWLQSSTLDHPGASQFYQNHGFKPYARAIERFPDPRLTGLLPRDCAPQVPLIGA